MENGVLGGLVLFGGLLLFGWVLGRWLGLALVAVPLTLGVGMFFTEPPLSDICFALFVVMSCLGVVGWIMSRKR